MTTSGVTPRAHELGQDVGGVADQRRPSARGPLRLQRAHARQRIVEIRRALVEVAGREPPLDACRIHFDDEGDAAVHRHRERLGAAHAAEAGGQVERPARLPPKWRRATAASVS